MTSYHIDKTDQKILSFLVNNARMPYLEIARECGVSGAAIHQRVSSSSPPPSGSMSARSSA